jgi:hypothetical protein
LSRSTLATGAVTAALEVISLCRILQDSVGLSKASYTEFSALRAALLVILAQSFNEHSDRLRNALKAGMILIRCMATDIDSAKSEVSVIESLELAVKKLDLSAIECEGNEESNNQYGRFKTWAATLGQVVVTDNDEGTGAVFSSGIASVSDSFRFNGLRDGPEHKTQSGVGPDLDLQFENFLESGWQHSGSWLDGPDIGVEFGNWR